MNLRKPTGLVFDLPHGSWMANILKLRSKYEPSRLKFPIEITAVGSSGLGWFSPTNKADTVLKEVRRFATETPAFSFSFKGVERFPSTNVYYLSIREPDPFHAFHRKFVNSKLKFGKTPFDYAPHCAIAILPENASAAAHREVAACAVPRKKIKISSVSIYSVSFERGECKQELCIPLHV